ncbi:MAG TPA: hypothetical protein PLS76_02550 [Acinetobacter sp.]|nr:hypothetical protein [Acinetobacter sp.]HQZ59986.1 hypothetical protein [Acinetobacter sp.]
MMSSYQPENSKLLWVIMSGISLVVVLFFAVQWFIAQKDQAPTLSKAPVAAKTATPVKEDVAPATEMTATAASEVAAPIKLVEDTIIKDALPANDSLAKEEIAKLDDIHTQLKDQQQDLKQQHTDVDTLLQLKEEQIKLLESQLTAQNHS